MGGSGASAVEAIKAAKPEDVAAACETLSPEARKRVMLVLNDNDKPGVKPSDYAPPDAKGFLELYCLAGLWQERPGCPECFRLQPASFDEENVAVKFTKLVDDGRNLPGSDIQGFTFDRGSCTLR